MAFARFGAFQYALVGFLGLACISEAAHAQKLDDGSETSMLRLEAKKNHFVRFGYIYVKPNEKIGVARDVTGPVLNYHEVKDLAKAGVLTDQNGATCRYNAGSDAIQNPTPSNGSYCSQWNFMSGTLDAAINNDYNKGIISAKGLGIPPVLTGTVAGSGTAAIEAGMFLDEDSHWAVEAFVIAAPLTSKVYAAGPNSISGKLVFTTQLLPPTVMLNYYFKDANSSLRPYVGLMGSYAIFFNSEATETLNSYASDSGRTTVKVNNAFGGGPVLGLQYKVADGWHLNAMFGYQKLKTTAYLTTHDTQLSATSPVISDYPKNSDIASAIDTVLGLNDGDIKTTELLKAVARTRGGSLGTYTRAIDSKLNPYIFNVSVGYEF